MSLKIKINPLIKKILWRAAKLPAIYAAIGILFIGLAYIDHLTNMTQWRNVFDVTDKIGNIFIALSFLTFIYRALILIIRRAEKKLFNHHKITSVIFSSLRKGLKIIFILITMNLIITLTGLTHFYLTLTNNIITTVMIASIGWITVQILYTIEAVIYQYMQTLTNEEHSRIKALYTKTHIIRNIGTVLIAIITFAAILMSFSSVRNIGISLLASAGFLTAIIGLSAQKALFSLFSGLQIALAQPVKIGDFVVIENESGIIEEITFTYVIIKLGDRRRLVVPIQYFTDKPFENWSRDYNSLRCSLHFYIDYLMPIEPLRHELDNILQISQYWDKKAKKLQVANLTERAVEIRVQVSAANADDLADLRAEVREKMLAFIREKYPDHLPRMRTS